MISIHLTHISAGIDRFNDIMLLVDKKLKEFTATVLKRDEYVLLKTCNRFEIYIDPLDPVRTMEDLREFIVDVMPQGTDFVYILSGIDCVKHLFRVSSGLDSLIVGEDQIQGQVRDAYVRAKEEGHAGRNIIRIFDRALMVGKKVRADSELGGDLSVGSAAVELVERKLGSLKGKTAAIMGAGEMSEIVAECLVRKGLELILVSSRTHEHAVRIADRIGGEVLERFDTTLAIERSDIFFMATSAPHTLLHRKEVKDAMEGRSDKLTIVDISAPRNVDDDVRDIHGVELITMESLSEIANDNSVRMMSKIVHAEMIVNAELELIENEIKGEAAECAIREINMKISKIREEELRRAKSIAGVSEVEDVFDDFSRVLVSRIMADTYDKLRQASKSGRDDICSVAADLFGVDTKCFRKQE